jgi:hypothetical protein
MTTAKIAVVVAAVIFAITLVSLASAHKSGGGHSSAWKYGYESSGDAISGCNQEAQNLVSMNVLGYDEWDDFVAGCKAAQSEVIS